MRRVSLCWLLVLLAGLAGLKGQYSPPGSPQFTTHWYGNTLASDPLYLGAYRVAPPFYLKATNFLLDHRGQTIWYQQCDLWALDFKLHPNGKMAYTDNLYWHVLDSNFAEVDSIGCQGGYVTDDHDFLMTADGHFFLICIEDTTIDLSSIHTTNGGFGSANAQVDGVVIQELDGAKNVVKEWHGLDHYSPSDVDSVYFYNPNRMELNHPNSLDVDGNGHLLLSHRALDEVTLIDWNSGNILWQLGGKNNDFDLQGDPGTKGQHDARFLGNDRISLFDNGNYAHAPRGMIYALDTTNWRATVEWAYEAAIGNTDAMGSMRTQPDGEALIGRGLLVPYSAPPVVRVAADCTVISDIVFADSSSTYRIQSMALPFALHRPQLTCDYVSGEVVLGLRDPATDYQWTTGENSATIVVHSPGWYQAFVPQGVGMIGTEPYEITNLNDACLALTQSEQHSPRPKQRHRVGYFDLMGRNVAKPETWQVVIERFNDGTSRKVVFR